VYIDEGAYRALTRHDKAGLLPVGVVAVEGTFAQQEPVSLVIAKKGVATDEWESIGVEVGRALVNYSSVEIARIKGKKSSEIAQILGYAGMFNPTNQWPSMIKMLILCLDTEYVAHRDNTAFFPERTKSGTDLKSLVAAAEEAEAVAEAAMEAAS